jgi:hypothetical protein
METSTGLELVIAVALGEEAQPKLWALGEIRACVAQEHTTKEVAR